MPESRNRHRHHHHTHTTATNSSKPKPKRSAAVVLAALAAIFGLAVAYFSEADTLFMIVGAVLGGVLGYFIGSGMDKAIEKDS